MHLLQMVTIYLTRRRASAGFINSVWNAALQPADVTVGVKASFFLASFRDMNRLYR